MRLVVLAIISTALLFGCSSQPSYKQTTELAQKADAAGNQKEATKLAETALKEAETAGVGCSEDYTQLVSFLCGMPNMADDKKIVLLQRSIDVALQVPKCPDRDKVLYDRYYELGKYCLDHKLYAQAIQPLKQALDKAIKLHGEDYCELAGIKDKSSTSDSKPTSLYAELAMCHERLGKFAAAEPLRRMDLTIHQKVFGVVDTEAKVDAKSEPKSDAPVEAKPSDPPVGTYNNELCALAANLASQEKYVEAERLYKQSMDLNERNRPKDTPKNVELSYVELAGLAEIYRAQSLVKQSQTCFESALAGFKASGKTDDPRYEETKANYEKLLAEISKQEETKASEEEPAKTSEQDPAKASEHEPAKETEKAGSKNDSKEDRKADDGEKH